jgi:hypothetical protein
MMDPDVTWTFVWQGAMTDKEAEAFLEDQPMDRIPLMDNGGLWLEALPERCEKEGHVPRFHPDESFQSYCVFCGEYPVANPALAEAAERAKDPEFQARYKELFGDAT